MHKKNQWVEITHTLTSAFCPFADQIVDDIKKAGYAPGVLNVEVVTTFDPPFTMDSVSEETKMIMGWF
jgi:metal-sulfur cluster biosynthetic enzyme